MFIEHHVLELLRSASEIKVQAPGRVYKALATVALRQFRFILLICRVAAEFDDFLSASDRYA